MKIDLTPCQVQALRGSINRTLMDMYAECSDEWEPDYPHKKTEICKENARETVVLQRVRDKIDSKVQP